MDLGLPVVLVVGLRLAGWVANTVDVAMPHVADNLAALEEGLVAPFLRNVLSLQDPSAPAIAAHLAQGLALLRAP